MKIADIATAHKVSPSLVYHVIDGRKKTSILGLAIDVARITGKRPIDHVTDKFQKIALAAHPELGKKVKSA